MTEDVTGDPHALAAAYRLDALDSAERTEFEAHLAGCEQCRSDVADFAAATELLADGTATPPPTELKARIMAEVARTAQEPPPAPAPTRSDVVDLTARRRRLAPRVLLAAAAAVAVLVAGAVVLNGGRGSGADVDAILDASDVRIVTLETLADDAPGTVEVAWSPDRDEIALIAEGVAEPGAGLIYALWAIADDEPIPAGLFDPDDGTIREAGDIVDIDAVAFGITIEPEAGSPAPTSDILYLGNV